MPKKKETTKIKINDKYFVEIDDYNYILNKYTEVTNKKTGEVSVKPIVQGYYPPYCSYSNNDVIYVVGLDKEKVNEVQQSILEERQNKNKSNIVTTKVKEHWWNRLLSKGV